MTRPGDLTAGVDDLLQQINDAVDDWDVSRDAMRCNAPADITRPGHPSPPASERFERSFVGTWDPRPPRNPGWVHVLITVADHLVRATYRRLRSHG